MKDFELLILKSFAYAVMQQKDLPDDIRQQIQAIASSLDTRVAELGSLARSSPLLAPYYRWAYRSLANSAAERGLGVPPADHDEDGPGYEIGNIVSHSDRYQLDEDKKTLEAINSRLNKANLEGIQQALSSEHPDQDLSNLIER